LRTCRSSRSKEESAIVVRSAGPEGIATLLLDAITERQRTQGASEQWVSVHPQNAKGIPFYLARRFEQRGERPEWGYRPR
jgi:GNAT superfamily N-acetyltransferase